MRKAALRQLRRTATGAAPQHTLRVGEQLRGHFPVAGACERGRQRGASS